MDIQFYGANCVSIASKGVRVVVDDNLADLGAKSVLKSGDIALFTGMHSTPSADTKIVIDHPGEYEVSEVSVYGIALRGHMDEEKTKDVTAYKIIMDDTRFLVMGHVFPELSETDLEAIGTVDVMFAPVGGNGYTTDPVGALKLVKQVDPKLVIPTHYDDSSLKLPMPQQTLEQAIHAFSMEPKEATDKLRLKAVDLAEGTHLVVINRTK
jgi:L-ascorbate metabolism protein UlaG (beta-lactamase superfamily)